METMFFGCENLQELNLINFNFENVLYVQGMFSGCKNLRSIYFPNSNLSFNLVKVRSFKSMFKNCINLSYLNLSTIIGNSSDSKEKMF